MPSSEATKKNGKRIVFSENKVKSHGNQWTGEPFS